MIRMPRPQPVAVKAQDAADNRQPLLVVVVRRLRPLLLADAVQLRLPVAEPVVRPWEQTVPRHSVRRIMLPLFGKNTGTVYR
jgi:hypothetical protein